MPPSLSLYSQVRATVIKYASCAVPAVDVNVDVCTGLCVMQWYMLFDTFL